MSDRGRDDVRPASRVGGHWEAAGTKLESPRARRPPPPAARASPCRSRAPRGSRETGRNALAQDGEVEQNVALASREARPRRRGASVKKGDGDVASRAGESSRRGPPGIRRRREWMSTPAVPSGVGPAVPVRLRAPPAARSPRRRAARRALGSRGPRRSDDLPGQAGACTRRGAPDNRRPHRAARADAQAERDRRHGRRGVSTRSRRSTRALMAFLPPTARRPRSRRRARSPAEAPVASPAHPDREQPRADPSARVTCTPSARASTATKASRDPIDARGAPRRRRYPRAARSGSRRA